MQVPNQAAGYESAHPLSPTASTLAFTPAETTRCNSVYEKSKPLDDPILLLSRNKKWTMTIVACLFTLLVSAATTSHTLGFASMMRDLNCTRPQAIIGLSTYVIAYGVFPLLTSAFSEEFGRQSLYIPSLFVFLAMHVGIALSPNYQVLAFFRFVQGAAGSSGATMVAGTIADLWAPHERGIPMSIYSLLAFGGNGVGAIMGGWIEMNPKLGWRWIQWISLIVGGVFGIIFLLLMQETRASVIIRKQTMRKITAIKRAEDGSSGSDPKSAESTVINLPQQLPPKTNLREVLWTSATRPLVLFLTEPIIFAISIWIGFAWGVVYCMISSVPAVFSEVHRFNMGQVGTVNTSLVIGSILGWATNMYQERLYHKSLAKRSVEARLHLCCIAAAVFPASMLMFAWSCRPEVPWIALGIAITLFIWAMFTIYLAVFNYMADCYDSFASSALAGQSLVRNIAGGVFPLFSTQLFDALGYTWANTIFACIGLAMIPIPITLFFYGSKIRARSARCVGGAEDKNLSLPKPSF